MRREKDCWSSGSGTQTYAWGKRLGRFLRPGDLLCLYGDLGAGKTLLVQGIGQALGVSEPVTSPTFNMIQSYRSGPENASPAVNLVHMDLYRLHSPAEAEIIGIWDFMTEDNIVVIEWPEVVTSGLPQNRYELHIAGSGEEPRVMQLSFLGAVGERWNEWESLKTGDNC